MFKERIEKPDDWSAPSKNLLSTELAASVLKARREILRYKHPKGDASLQTSGGRCFVTNISRLGKHLGYQESPGETTPSQTELDRVRSLKLHGSLLDPR